MKIYDTLYTKFHSKKSSEIKLLNAKQTVPSIICVKHFFFFF